MKTSQIRFIVGAIFGILLIFGCQNETKKDGVVVDSQTTSEAKEKGQAFIEDDELVEVTPHSVRLRKKLLTENARKRNR